MLCLHFLYVVCLLDWFSFHRLDIYQVKMSWWWCVGVFGRRGRSRKETLLEPKKRVRSAENIWQLFRTCFTVRLSRTGRIEEAPLHATDTYVSHRYVHYGVYIALPLLLSFCVSRTARTQASAWWLSAYCYGICPIALATCAAKTWRWQGKNLWQGADIVAYTISALLVSRQHLPSRFPRFQYGSGSNTMLPACQPHQALWYALKYFV